jgi:low temperature requirement protein LtrA
MSSAPQARVSMLELFFDLVFVFTVTQIARLMSAAHGIGDFGSAFLILTIAWWMYGGYAWLTNNVGTDGFARRMLLLAGMASYFVMALAIPAAGAHDGVTFGVAFAIVTVVHATLFYNASPTSARAILGIAPYNLTAAACVIAAGLFDPRFRAFWWLGAVAMFLAATFLRREQRFSVNASHFAERHGLIIIVAIGESIVSLGSGLGPAPIGWPLVRVVVLGFALCAAIWWTYFDGDDTRGEHALKAAEPTRQLRLAILAYSYAHLGMLLGIVCIAAGLHDAIAELGGAVSVSHAWVLGAGVAIYLASDKWFRWLLRIGSSRYRSAAAVIALASAPLGWRVNSASQIAVLLAALVVMLAAERGR